jgi:hypothetical protein
MRGEDDNILTEPVSTHSSKPGIPEYEALLTTANICVSKNLTRKSQSNMHRHNCHGTTPFYSSLLSFVAILS